MLKFSRENEIYLEFDYNRCHKIEYAHQLEKLFKLLNSISHRKFE